MRRFTQLFHDLDERNRPGDKRLLLEAYFRSVPAEDAAWSLWFLWGNRLRTGISPRRLKKWALEISGCPAWLAETCQSTVGDLGETAALLLPPAAAGPPPSLSRLMERYLKGLYCWDEGFQFPLYREFIQSLGPGEAPLVHKLLTGPLRIGLSKRLLVKALANHFQVPPADLAMRLAADWKPGAAFFRSLGRPLEASGGTEVRDLKLARLLQDLEDEPDGSGEEPRYRARLVLIYAQAGRGGGQQLFTELTLAARDGERLVGVVKTGRGLEPPEKKALDRWIRENTLARRGPVRTVPAEMVFEVGFERLRPSRRHKSGLEIRYPRILAWLREAGPETVDTLDRLRECRDV